MDIERQWNSPEVVIARALQMENQKIDALKQQNLQLAEAMFQSNLLKNIWRY